MSKSGIAGDFQYVLILNPIIVIENHFKGKEKNQSYNALISRLMQVGADDLDDMPLVYEKT